MFGQQHKSTVQIATPILPEIDSKLGWLVPHLDPVQTWLSARQNPLRFPVCKILSLNSNCEPSVEAQKCTYSFKIPGWAAPGDPHGRLRHPRRLRVRCLEGDYSPGPPAPSRAPGTPPDFSSCLYFPNQLL